jgi:hypothetical protein
LGRTGAPVPFFEGIEEACDERVVLGQRRGIVAGLLLDIGWVDALQELWHDADLARARI